MLPPLTVIQPLGVNSPVIAEPDAGKRVAKDPIRLLVVILSGPGVIMIRYVMILERLVYQIVILIHVVAMI